MRGIVHALDFSSGRVVSKLMIFQIVLKCEKYFKMWCSSCWIQRFFSTACFQTTARFEDSWNIFLYFIPHRSILHRVRMCRLNVQHTDPSPPTSLGGHNLYSTPQVLHALKERDLAPSTPSSIHYRFHFLIASTSVSPHTLTGNILITAKICKKCIWLTRQPVVMWKVCFCSWHSNMISWVNFLNS